MVLLPERLAALRAACLNRLQTSMNLALSSARASICLAIPAVAAVSIVLGTPLALGLGSKEQVLLALTLLVVVVVVPSRVRSLTRAFGVEKVLGLHRWLGTLAIVLVGVHMAVAILNHPSLLNPFQGSAAARAGSLSTRTTSRPTPRITNAYPAVAPTNPLPTIPTFITRSLPPRERRPRAADRPGV